MRTIPDIAEYLRPLEDAIRNQLIPALTEQQVVNDVEREMISLPARLGGLGIPTPGDEADHEFENSTKLTANLTTAIVEQSSEPVRNDREMRRIISCENATRQKIKQTAIEQRLSATELKLHKINQQKGASSWLTAMPTAEHGFHLSKREFWDSIRMRFGWPINNLPTNCACGKPNSTNHAQSCHLGGFTSIRHNELRDLTASMLQKVCHDVRIEPPLEPLTGETFAHRTANTAQEARLDISVRGLWVPYQKVFADVRVVNPGATRYARQSPSQILELNANEKKRHYCRRVLEVENATFTPLIFTTNGGMGNECIAFYSRIAKLLAEKWDMDSSQTTAWVRTRLSFALIRSTVMAIRGSRRWSEPISVAAEEVELTGRWTD